MDENDNEISNAQETATADDPQVQAQETEVQQDVQEPAVPAGVQKRIDELTALKHEQGRKLEAYGQQLDQVTQKYNDLMARIATSSLGQPQKPPEEEEDDLSPEDRKRLDKYMGRMLKPFEEQISRLTGHLEAQQRQKVDEETNARLAKLNNPAINAKVDELMRNWKTHPIYKNATRQDAYYIALGMLHDEGVDKAVQARNEKGQFDKNASQVVTTPGGGASRARQVAGTPAFFEKPVEEMSPQELAQYVEASEKANPNGFNLD